MSDFKGKLKKAVSLYIDKNVSTMASSISFLTVLSLTPFLLLFFATLVLIGWQNFGEIQAQIIEALGPGASLFVKSIGPNLEKDEGGFSFGFLGLVTIIYAASRIVSELKDSIEKILNGECSHEYRDNASQSKVLVWMKTKVFSIVAIIFCIFLFTVSLVFSTFINYFFSTTMASSFDVLNYIVSFSFFTFIFYLMFYFLPKPKPNSRFALKAAAVCSVLFHIGKIALEAYFSNSSMESSYGALSSFVILILWAYYNGLIILISACIAKAFFNYNPQSSNV
jgi:membrane protein